MRAVLLRVFCIAALAATAASLAGCDDPLGLDDPVIQTDTITLAAPTSASALPSAIEITNFNVLRFPELPAQALAWDFQLRQEGSTFLIAPVQQVDRFRGAGIQPADRDIEQVQEAPRARDSYTRTPLAVTVGQTYYLQSRQTRSLCVKFGALKVLSVDPAAGTARIVVRSNQNTNCDDERLTN